jgi:hypothetical protein
MIKLRSVEDYRLRSTFEAICRQLREHRNPEWLEKPLAYWALPKDRRLPLALMDRSLRSVIETPFEQLSATPGIGQKKILSLVKLLNRAARFDPPPAPMLPVEEVESTPCTSVVERHACAAFDPEAVSELLWSQWCETVHRHGLGREKLGRLVVTLRDVPTVIWHTPLEHYMQQSVGEIRMARTYGEKRVRVILEVFHNIHDMLAGAVPGDDLAIRLIPAAIARAESWLGDRLCRSEIPSEFEVRMSFLQPLLEQIQRDSGPDLFRLVAERLGQGRPRLSVREQALDRNVTRARIYQMFEMCAKIMRVRWPMGASQAEMLATKVRLAGIACRELVGDVQKLFFPAVTGGTVNVLEHAISEV